MATGQLPTCLDGAAALVHRHGGVTVFPRLGPSLTPVPGHWQRNEGGRHMQLAARKEMDGKVLHAPSYGRVNVRNYGQRLAFLASKQ
jgi:hypothetical protein